MSCDELRNRLTKKNGEGLSENLRQHLRGCSACRGFAERLEIARDLLRLHHADVKPDAGFAGRVTARLEEMGAAEALVWAAGRLLWATVALTLVLASFALRTGPQFAVEAEGVDYLEWILEDTEEAP